MKCDRPFSVFARKCHESQGSTGNPAILLEFPFSASRVTHPQNLVGAWALLSGFAPSYSDRHEPTAVFPARRKPPHKAPPCPNWPALPPPPPNVSPGPQKRFRSKPDLSLPDTTPRCIAQWTDALFAYFRSAKHRTS